MAIEIRRVGEEELPAFVDALSTAFLERLDVEKVAAEVKPLWDLERTWAAFDDGRVCGSFRSWATELTVPGGGRLPAAAVAAVTVRPTHRRRGILRRMVAAEHSAMRERGEAVGLLYASEYPIYGRFGYGPGIRNATWVVDALTTSFHGDAPTGSIQIETPGEAIRDEIKAVGEAWRLRQPGEIRRRDYHWDFDLGLRANAWGPTWNGFLAVHRDASGVADGYVRYRADQKWEHGQPRSTLEVDDLHVLTGDAHAAIWRFLVEMDWVATVRAERQSPSDRLPWLLTNARAARMEGVGEGMWVRLFDLPRAMQARTYTREGSIVLEVIDAEAVDGRRRIHLDAGPAGATCRPTDRPADLTIDVSALGAAYLGGTPLGHAVLARGADEHRTGALAEAEALLRMPDEPRCSTFF
jgi:predicted acetyltransferase